MIVCSHIVRMVQSGGLAPTGAVQQLRELCEAVVAACWAAGRQQHAQAASDLLDEANELLQEFDSQEAAAAVAPLPVEPPPRTPKPTQPPETFFLPADLVRQCLTVDIDSSILLRSQQGQAGHRGGWPPGKRRKTDGASHGAGRLARAQLGSACKLQTGGGDLAQLAGATSTGSVHPPAQLHIALQDGARASGSTTLGQQSYSSSWPLYWSWHWGEGRALLLAPAAHLKSRGLSHGRRAFGALQGFSC